MRIVVDTNIVFSALLNAEGGIGALLLNSSHRFEFYSCAYMQTEIERHWLKLLKISRLTEAELQVSYRNLLPKIRFIHEGMIPAEVWRLAEELVRDIDPDDVDFVALAYYLEASLWTGDKVLHDGLRQRRFEQVYTTTELLNLRFQ